MASSWQRHGKRHGKSMATPTQAKARHKHVKSMGDEWHQGRCNIMGNVLTKTWRDTLSGNTCQGNDMAIAWELHGDKGPSMGKGMARCES